MIRFVPRKAAGMRPGRLALAPTIAGASALTLAASIVVGLRLPNLGLLSPLPDAAALDYSKAPAGGFTPLSDTYLETVLGQSLSRAPFEGARPGAVANPRTFSSTKPAVLHDLTNDDFRDAYPIPSVPFTGRTNTSTATREQGESASCAPVGGTAWYRFRPAKDQGLVADTFGSGYATALAAFQGSNPGNLRQVGCDIDQAGNAQVGFAAKASETYFFQITGAVGGGALVFTLAPAGVTRRLSLSSSGKQAAGMSHMPAFSADGRFVAFRSFARDLVPETPPCVSAWEAGDCAQIYVRDRRTGTTEIVSVSSARVPANETSTYPSISDDGRYVVFWSLASNLVDGDTNGVDDVFVHDRATRATRRVSISTSGEQQAGDPLTNKWEASYASSYGWDLTYGVAISGDGRYVAFDSRAGNLVPADTNQCAEYVHTYVYPVYYTYSDHQVGWRNCYDVFVHDTLTHTTTRVSLGREGRQADDDSYLSSMSRDGRVVAFTSQARNLVPGDPLECQDGHYEPASCSDLFVYDRVTEQPELVSVSSTGEWGDAHTPIGTPRGRTISSDNRYVVFASWARNLVAGDRNNYIDVFVRDRITRTTELVSLSSTGAQQRFLSGDLDYAVFTDWVYHWSMSEDGRYVAFASDAYNLVPNDTNRLTDIFLHDRVTRTTIRVSVSSAGVEADGRNLYSVISANGREVAYSSGATNLVPDDTNRDVDVFVYERP